MPCSSAQLEANQKNSLKSTGPKTPEGKAISRGNSYKHGLSGEGVVLPHEDATEVARRAEAMQAEMAPKNELSRNLVIKVALATMRLERCALHETKSTAYQMRHAQEQFDDARLSEVEKALSWIAAEPATHARRLRGSPEGIDLLVRELERLKTDITRPHGIVWTYQHAERLHHVMGLRWVEVPFTRARCLGEAILGKMEHLGPDDRPDLNFVDRQVWAAIQLIELIDAELAKLKTLREAIDFEAIALDRAEAPFRALFDASPAAILARKYEAALERGLYRALQEFRQAQELPPQVALEKAFEFDPLDQLASSPPGLPGEKDGSADLGALPVETAGAAAMEHLDPMETANHRRDRPKLNRSKRR